MYIAGLDIGTTGCKVVVYDEQGSYQSGAYREYEVKRSSGLHEIDAESIYDAVISVLSEVKSYDIAALGITSFGETFVMLDENDKPAAPSMLYTDPRGKEECKNLVEKFGINELSLKTGTIPHEMYSISKIMWIKNNMPEKFKKVRHILLMQDFISYMLTGVAKIDYSLAARTGAFDIKNKCYIDEIFKFCDVDKSLMSCPVPSGSIVGNMKIDVMQKIGQKGEVKVVSGCHDQIAALTGAGVFENGEAMDGIGTVECVPIVIDEVPNDLSLYESGYSVVPHVNGKYACYILSYAGGAAIKWFRDNFASGISYDELNKQVADGPTDLLLMPHFAGAATPHMDISSRAAIVGLTFEHTKSDIYKAIMEGTSFEILLNIVKIAKYGLKLDYVTATGGGAKSDVWLQIKADIFGIPVQSLEQGEIGGAGTALLAGKAIGIYSEKTMLINKRKLFIPDDKKHELYSKQFKKYEKMYETIRMVRDCE